VDAEPQDRRIEMYVRDGIREDIIKVLPVGCNTDAASKGALEVMQALYINDVKAPGWC